MSQNDDYFLAEVARAGLSCEGLSEKNRSPFVSPNVCLMCCSVFFVSCPCLFNRSFKMFLFRYISLQSQKKQTALVDTKQRTSKRLPLRVHLSVPQLLVAVALNALQQRSEGQLLLVT